MREIIRDIDEEKEVQDKANADLESASRDANKTRDQIQKVNKENPDSFSSALNLWKHVF